MIKEPENPCGYMSTRECLMLCDITGYCFRFPHHQMGSFSTKEQSEQPDPEGETAG